MRLVVLRFSALGDVTLLVPVLQHLATLHPEKRITIVSRPHLAPLFAPLPVDFFPANLKGQHQGIMGLWRLARQIHRAYRREGYQVFDQHAVLRTYLVVFFLRLRGIKVWRLRKDRPARKTLTAPPPKQLKPLPHVTQRYWATFHRSGLVEADPPPSWPVPTYKMAETAAAWWTQHRGRLNLAFAPTAAHASKRWPRDYSVQLLRRWAREKDARVWLLGAPAEKAELEALLRESGADGGVLAGRYPFDQEIALLEEMDALVAMDSFNMHLGALAAVPLLVIWGGTHPAAGFAPVSTGPQEHLAVPQEELACRPCSIYGREDCPRQDFACLQRVAPAQAWSALQRLIPSLEA